MKLSDFGVDYRLYEILATKKALQMVEPAYSNESLHFQARQRKFYALKRVGTNDFEDVVIPGQHPIRSAHSKKGLERFGKRGAIMAKQVENLLHLYRM
jgi:hypothetical protein